MEIPALVALWYVVLSGVEQTSCPQSGKIESAELPAVYGDFPMNWPTFYVSTQITRRLRWLTLKHIERPVEQKFARRVWEFAQIPLACSVHRD